MREKFLFYTKGGKDVGLGHVRRSLAIAKGIKMDSVGDVIFALIGDETTLKLIEDAGFSVLKGKKFEGIVKELKPRIVIIDIKDDFSKEIKFLSDKNITTVLIDNATDARLFSDFVIYPVAHFIDNLSWDGFKGKKLIGAEYFPLDESFLKCNRRMIREKKSDFTILISIGGADPMGLTLKITNALRRMSERFKATVVVAPCFQFKEELCKIPDSRFSIKDGMVDMADFMAEADIAITAFGITLYELAYMGVPAVIVSNYRDDEKDINAFVKFGTSKAVGFYQDVDDEMIRKTVRKLMKDKKLLEEMSQKGMALVDGGGVGRICKLLRNEVSTSKHVSHTLERAEKGKKLIGGNGAK